MDNLKLDRQKLAEEFSRLSPEQRAQVIDAIKEAKRREAVAWIVRGVVMACLLIWLSWSDRHETGKDPMSWIDWAGIGVFVLMALSSVAIGVAGLLPSSLALWPLIFLKRRR